MPGKDGSGVQSRPSGFPDSPNQPYSVAVGEGGCLCRNCGEVFETVGPAAGRHLPRLRIECVLFLGEGKRGQRSMADIW